MLQQPVPSGPFLAIPFDPIDADCPLQFPARDKRPVAGRDAPAAPGTAAEHGAGGGPQAIPAHAPVAVNLLNRSATGALSPSSSAAIGQKESPSSSAAIGQILAQVAQRRQGQLDRGHTVAGDAENMRQLLRAVRGEVQDLCDHLLMQPPAATAEEGAADRAKLNRIARREAITLAALAVAVVEAIDFIQQEQSQ